MICERCSGKTRVIRTEAQEDGSVRRRRICLNAKCAHRFWTKEAAAKRVYKSSSIEYR